jgi:hypothetical protein
MNTLSTEEMNNLLFDEWQEKLFRFVYENKRKFTKSEWKWMRYQFEIEHLYTGENAAPLALAADGNKSHNIETKSWFFTGSDGEQQYRIQIKRSFIESKKSVEFFIDCTYANGEELPLDENGNTPLVKLLINDEFQLNNEGWLVISESQYTKAINCAMGMQCIVGSGKKFDLILVEEN